MDLLTWATLLAITVKVLSMIKFAEAKEWRSLRVQVYAFGLGIAAIFLGSAVQGVQLTEVSGFALEDLEFWSKVFVGMALGASGSLVVDTITAVDNSRSSRI